MKRLLSLAVGAAMLVSLQTVWADDAGKAAAVSTPMAGPAVVAKHKTKKAKVSKKKEVQSTWVCPMGDYSGPKTADGKCPKCGMDLVEKK